MSSVVVQLQKFEGPLALLLYLIRKEEMDIFDIKIHEITHQYLEYIKIMKELDLEVAGEFIAMAATLIQIKSRMLLPQYNEQGEVIEAEDPRKELVQKLLEYQKYQEAARLLYERPLMGREMWTRGLVEDVTEPVEDVEVEDNGLFSLISMYRRLMRSAKKRIHEVAAKAQSIASRILELKDILVMGQRKTLNELLTSMEDRTRQILITFLSLLELGKLGFVSLYQSETYGDIWVDLIKPIERDVVSRVEEYDTVHSEETANKLFGSPSVIPVSAQDLKTLNEERAGESDGETEVVTKEVTKLDGNPSENSTIELSNSSSEEFVMGDSSDYLSDDEKMEPLFTAEEMASDEEILLAEQELEDDLNKNDDQEKKDDQEGMNV